MPDKLKENYKLWAEETQKRFADEDEEKITMPEISKSGLWVYRSVMVFLAVCIMGGWIWAGYTYISDWMGGVGGGIMVGFFAGVFGNLWFVPAFIIKGRPELNMWILAFLYLGTLAAFPYGISLAIQGNNGDVGTMRTIISAVLIIVGVVSYAGIPLATREEY